MISLIINADDLGCNHERDRGILRAHQEGVVTSASLLANGSSFISAIEDIKQSNLPIGVHLNLADGKTLSGEIKGLTGAEGELPGKQKLRQYLAAGGSDQKALRRELKAQIERVMSAGVIPDHLDSHQHCQLFPCMSNMITELAIEYDIKAMRTSRPAESEDADPPGELGKEISLYRQLADAAHRAIYKAGLRTPDGIWGMPFLNNLDEAGLCHLLEDIPAGTWELMTHPGHMCENGSLFNGWQREVELQSLLSPFVREVIERRNIQLITFGDLPCGS